MPGRIPHCAPTTVAPVRRIVHPTRFHERHHVVRYPIEHIYPSHTRNIRHNICEHYCRFPHTESFAQTTRTIDRCGRPFGPGPF